MAVSQTDEREARAARTQSLFRDVNERVREVNEAFGEYIPHGDWLCECADDACSERIALTHSEYEAVRADGSRFAVAPSEAHVFPEVEDVTKQTDRYWIVEKRGIAGELTKKIDPRRVGLHGRPVRPRIDEGEA